MADKYDALLLRRQLCFRLYSTSREVVRRYKPLLDPLNLTYPQYLAMMVLWEESPLSVKELGKRLQLDSGTLTPMFKKLEAHGFVKRERSQDDERVVMISLTEAGMQLREKAVDVPPCLFSSLGVDPRVAKKLIVALDDFNAQLAQNGASAS